MSEIYKRFYFNKHRSITGIGLIVQEVKFRVFPFSDGNFILERRVVMNCVP